MAKNFRADYSIIRKKYEKAKGDKKGKSVRLTQSSLLLLKAINSATDTYQFPVLETDTPAAAAEEIRLNMNDQFISYEVAYYVKATGTLPTDPITTMQSWYLTYAPIELNTSFGNTNGAWDGTLSILVNKISRLEKWDLKKHNVIPRTQFSNKQVATTLKDTTQPSIDYSDHGTYPMQPMLTLSGAKKNTIDIDLVSAIASTSAGTFNVQNAIGSVTVSTVTVNSLILIFRGMLAQNAAKFQ